MFENCNKMDSELYNYDESIDDIIDDDFGCYISNEYNIDFINNVEDIKILEKFNRVFNDRINISDVDCVVSYINKYKNITTFCINLFDLFKNLTSISLPHCNITSLKIFTESKTLSRIQRLDLSNNNIDNIIYFYSCNFDKLQHLNLSNNLITKIHNNSFYYLPTLKSLNLSSTKCIINYIEYNSFNGLINIEKLTIKTTIILDQNMIFRMPKLTSLTYTIDNISINTMMIIYPNYHKYLKIQYRLDISVFNPSPLIYPHKNGYICHDCDVSISPINISAFYNLSIRNLEYLFSQYISLYLLLLLSEKEPVEMVYIILKYILIININNIGE